MDAIRLCTFSLVRHKQIAVLGVEKLINIKYLGVNLLTSLLCHIPLISDMCLGSKLLKFFISDLLLRLMTVCQASHWDALFLVKPISDCLYTLQQVDFSSPLHSFVLFIAVLRCIYNQLLCHSAKILIWLHNTWSYWYTDFKCRVITILMKCSDTQGLL